MPHITTGVASLMVGVIALTSAKRRGLHTRVGSLYAALVLVVCISAMLLSLLRWQELWWLFLLGAFSLANLLLGYVPATRRRRGWLLLHIGGMGGSFIALVSALLVTSVDNPTFLTGSLPSLVGALLMTWTIVRVARGPLCRHLPKVFRRMTRGKAVNCPRARYLRLPREAR